MTEDLQPEELKAMIKSLRDILKCPVCLEALRKDTVTCINGHCICAKCQGTQKICPSCRERFTEMKQNSLARQVGAIIPHTCRYRNCSYQLKGEDEHDSYCIFKPTSCKYCNQEVPTIELVDHVVGMHRPGIFLGTMGPTSQAIMIQTSRIYDLSNIWNRRNLFSADGHFFWHLQEFDPTVGVLTIKFIPEFCGKPKHNVNVKVSFESDLREYEVSKEIKMNSGVDANEENCVLIPVSVLRKCFSKEESAYTHSVSLTASKE